MTTMNASTTLDFPDSYYQFQSIKHLLDKISIPYLFLISLIGLITNTSTIFLISKHFITKNLKNKWTLIALALSDLLFNTALLVRAIYDVFRGTSKNLCMILSFGSHLAELLSACYTVSFTIQRYTAVRHPLKVAMNRRSSPIISLLIIFLSSSIFCFLLTYENVFVHCHEQLELRWFIADGVLSFFIPFLLIIIFNILIISFIRKYSRSPITTQTTLIKKHKHYPNDESTLNQSLLIKKSRCFRNAYKHYQRDHTCISENNTLSNLTSTMGLGDDHEHIELKDRKEEKTSVSCLDQQLSPLATRESLDQMNSDSSINAPTSQCRLTSSILPRSQSENVRRSSNDSFIYRLNGRSSSLIKEQPGSGITTTRTSQSIRVTRMLVLVSTCFLVLNAPAHICVIAMKIYTGPDLVPTPGDQFKIDSSHWNSTVAITSASSLPPTIVEDTVVVHILYLSVFFTQLIAYASYSINFFLYSFSGIAFRTSIRQSFSQLRGQ